MRKYKPRETVQSLSKKIAAAIEATLDSQCFKDYLRTMALFHKYSFHNQMLILTQKPDATRVAGYVAWREWREKFNRQVVKDAQSIAIFGHPKVTTVEETQDDGSKEITEKTWWPIVHVFDIKNTEGDSLPDLDRRHVPDDSPRASTLLERLIDAVKANGIHYDEVDRISGTLSNSNTLGAFSPAENTIQLVNGNGVSRGELFKTLGHELGHALYTDRNLEGHSYAFEECVVETSSMIVASHFGLDLAPYDVSYVAGWSNGNKILYREGLENATQLVSTIISQLETQKEDQSSTRLAHYTWVRSSKLK